MNAPIGWPAFGAQAAEAQALRRGLRWLPQAKARWAAGRPLHLLRPASRVN